MIASDEHNSLELLRLRSDPAHRGLGLLATTVPCQVARMNENFALRQNRLGIVSIRDKNESCHFGTAAQIAAAANQ